MSATALLTCVVCEESRTIFLLNLLVNSTGADSYPKASKLYNSLYK